MRSKTELSLAYKSAFQALLPKMDKTKERVLRLMMGLPNHTASSRLLLKLLGVQHHIIVNQALGQLGGQIYKQIGFHPDGPNHVEDEKWTVIAELGDAIDEGYPWKLRPEVVRALRSVGFEEESPLGEEVIPPALWEGAVISRLVNVYERSSEARRACLAKYGCKCAICKFDFGEVYGESMSGFIHVHHLVPLAQINQRYEIDPLNDLIPVCPNCHAVIHFGKMNLSIAHVRKMLSKTHC